MRKIVPSLYLVAGHVGFVGVISIVLMPVYILDLPNAYFILFGSVVVIVCLPALNFMYAAIDRYLLDEAKDIVPPEKINVIFQAQTVEALINNAFERMMQLLSSRSGKIIIHNITGDSFDIYEQSRGKGNMLRNAPVSFTDPLFKALAETGNVVVKRKLDPKRGYDARLLDDFNRYDAEIVAPIYYHEKFLGAFLVGGHTSRYSAREVELTRSFASKIGTLFMNSFLWRESLQKKDIEREYELGKKVQSNFYPPMRGTMGGYEYALSFPRTHGTIRQYCDLYSEYGDLSLSLFMNSDPTPGSFVFLPSVIPVVQTFFRRGAEPSEIVIKTMSAIVERGITEVPLHLLCFRLSGRQIKWARTGYGAPLVFNLATEDAHYAPDDGFAGEYQMHRGLLLLVFDEEIYLSIERYYGDIVRELKIHKLKTLQMIADHIAEAVSVLSGKKHLVGVFRIVR
jgi:hypothetical protein